MICFGSASPPPALRSSAYTRFCWLVRWPWAGRATFDVVTAAGVDLGCSRSGQRTRRVTPFPRWMPMIDRLLIPLLSLSLSLLLRSKPRALMAKEPARRDHEQYSSRSHRADSRADGHRPVRRDSDRSPVVGAARAAFCFDRASTGSAHEEPRPADGVRYRPSVLGATAIPLGSSTAEA